MSRKNPIANIGQINYCPAMLADDPRHILEQLIQQNGHGFAAISKMLGKNPAYIQQYIRRGSPKKLDERDRRILAEFYGVNEQSLGGPSTSADIRPSRQQFDARVQEQPLSWSSRPVSNLLPITRLRIGASAGQGSLADEAPGEAIGFGPRWLRKLGVEPKNLSLITVDGDSMQPTLFDGDDIMVDRTIADQGGGAGSLRDGIYVLRMDDLLLVKRIAVGPSGKISIRSDNPQYRNWDDVDVAAVNIIGRVVWAGRRL